MGRLAIGLAGALMLVSVAFTRRRKRKALVRSRHRRKTPPSSTRPRAPVSAAGARLACAASAAPPVAGARPVSQRIRAFAMSRSETVGSRRRRI